LMQLAKSCVASASHLETSIPLSDAKLVVERTQLISVESSVYSNE